MKFGVSLANIGSLGPGVGVHGCLDIAQAADELGFDSVCVGDHLVLPVDIDYDESHRDRQGATRWKNDVFEALTVLSAVAATTKRVRLFQGVMILPLRHPILLAKVGATIDCISNGRFTLGAGVGWMPEEFDALNLPEGYFEHRGSVGSEYLQAVKELWTSDGPSNFRGKFISFGASAFYSGQSSRGSSSCFYTALTDCAFVNIDDFDSLEENNTGPFGQFTTTTRRNVHYWGFSVDARPGGPTGTGESERSPLKFGVGARGLHERSNLHAMDAVVTDPVDYKERLDTLYLGAFAGIEHVFDLGAGWSLGIDGQAGIYGATTDYQGRYLGYVPVGGPLVVPEQGSLTLSDHAASFIGSGRIDLRRDMGWGTFGIYGAAEYFSQVPFVLYNNNDAAGGSPFGVVGTEVGTKLSWKDAMNYTVGLNLTVPLDKAGR